MTTPQTDAQAVARRERIERGEKASATAEQFGTELRELCAKHGVQTIYATFHIEGRIYEWNN